MEHKHKQNRLHFNITKAYLKKASTDTVFGICCSTYDLLDKRLVQGIASIWNTPQPKQAPGTHQPSIPSNHHMKQLNSKVSIEGKNCVWIKVPCKPFK